MSSEIDRVTRTCFVIECNGMGIILLMSGYAAACADEMRLHRTTEWWGYATATRRCGASAGEQRQPQGP